MKFLKPQKSTSLDQDEVQIWVEQARQGDSRAFGYVYEHFLPLIYRFVYFRLSSKEDAEDLTEQIFLKVFKAMPKFNTQKSSFKTWIFTIARHAVIDFYRTHKVTYELKEAMQISTEDYTEEEIDKQLALDKIMPVLKALPEEQSEVLALRFISGLSTSETAAIMKKSEGALRILQHRALKALKNDLEPIII